MRIAIVGKTNAGKSTLFNKIVEKKQAIVSSQDGTTRDINKSQSQWQGISFNLYDTAGLDINPANDIDKKTKKQSLEIIKKADKVIFVLDGTAPILPQDKEIAQLLRQEKKRTILAVNKIDNNRLREKIDINEFIALGFPEIILVSAVNGSGVGDLLDKITEGPLPAPVRKPISFIKISIIGKPNVGKSSLLNALIRLYNPEEDQVIVSSIPYTTRDKQPRLIKFDGQVIEFIDTPGVRKKAKIKKQSLEKSSAQESLRTMKKSDVVIFVLDISRPLSAQDKKLAGLIKKNYKSLLVIANKWDLVKEKNTSTEKNFSEYIQQTFPFLKEVPFLFLSALTRKNIKKILPLIKKIYLNQNKKIPEKKLEKFLKKIIKKQSPVQAKGPKKPFIYKIEQNGISPPLFTITVSNQTGLHFSYLRFLENELRKEFGFFGTNIKIIIKKRASS